ncbi:hypothetical protein D9757_011937 [Collybiopsis confluens]|uniref:DUF6534 domain-containing protein n=1 Tax=Collybiopsis confluens TaxID=2823264 RepID=A0A8H5GKV1_9AGAR|nr:hypothetical protein D9757_011937 [Collybiopsis confluens]
MAFYVHKGVSIFRTYYENFPKDPIRIKILVVFLLALVTAQIAMNIYDVLSTFGTHFSDVDAIQKVNMQWIASPIFTAIASFSVQVFYAHRMMLFSKLRYIKVVASIVVMLALFASITSVIVGVKSYWGQLEENIFNDSLKYEQMWLISSALCDTIITATMIFLLRLSILSNHTKTGQMISRMIRQLIETGFVTAVFAVADLCVFMIFPSQIYHVAICDGFPNVYTLTLIVILNGRSRLSNRNSDMSWNVAPGALGRSHTTTTSQSNEDGQESVIQPTGIKEV